MAVKASASVTISRIIDISRVYRYYYLSSSMTTPVIDDTVRPPTTSGQAWTDSEPAYTGGTYYLYFTDCTVLTNNTFTYSEISLSSSYEAAKAAYNLAEVAKETADEKVGQNYVDGRFETTEAALTRSANELGARITEVSGDITSVRTRTTSLEATAEGLQIEIDEQDRTLQSHGSTIENINANFTFGASGLEIGREGSTSTAVFDNDSLEFKVNQATVAEFTKDALNVRNVEAGNQVGFFGEWAIRKGAAIGTVGSNLNDVWIGG